MMKRCLSVCLALTLLCTLFSAAPAIAEDGIEITINGAAQVFDQMPVMVNDRVLVPMRGIFEALGAEVSWDDATQTATGTKDGKVVSLSIGNTQASIDGTAVTLDVPAQLISDRTMVPVRFISEALGAQVSWDDAANTVIIAAAKGNYPYPDAANAGMRRPVPDNFSTGKSYEDLIYFNDKGSPDEAFASLPQGTVIVSEEDFLNADTEGTANYGPITVVDVEGQPFDKALRFEVQKVPDAIYSYNARILFDSVLEEGHIYLLKVSMRTVSGGDIDSGVGKVQLTVQERETNSYSGAVQKDIMVPGEWTTTYIPFSPTSLTANKKFRIQVRPGYFEQVVEVGGYQLIDYGTSVTMDDMPDSSYYPGMEQDAQWRRDAWARIEQNRKGDINVLVQDAAGNPVPNADVQLNMYEHEFEWGTALNSNLLGLEGTDGDQYRNAVPKYFNSAVLENEHKWVYYEEDPQRAMDMVDWALANGIKHLRGHALMWDRSYSDGNSSFPLALYNVFNDRAAMDAMIKEHIFEEAGAFTGKIQDWDVLNEMAHIDTTTVFKTTYGPEIYKDWFAWAREAAPDADLYVNEGVAKDTKSTGYQDYKEFLDWAKANNLDYDGIGIQGHLGGYPFDPMDFYALLEDFAQYGKKIKITEFDAKTSGSNNTNPELIGNFTRDILIATFSHPSVEGLYMWGFWDARWTDAPLFFDDWSLKPSGEQFADLVYNKWWTEEAGTTGTDGTFSTRGYYGDYDITVTANGQSKTVQAQCYKGNDNTIVVTLG